MTASTATKAGSPLPLGATPNPDGVNFSVYAPSTATVTLNIHQEQHLLKFKMHKTGNVHHLFIPGLQLGTLYSYDVDSCSQLLDPYAHETNSEARWDPQRSVYAPVAAVASENGYDWEGDTPPRIPKEKLIIYEMHVRAFTQDPSSQSAAPGSFRGVQEKIYHLKDLGVNAIEFLPLFEFNEAEYKKINLATNTPLCNFWGYSTVNFFSPMNRYGSKKELKDLVKALHQNGMEVILDVVYNHTAEGGKGGPLLSYKGFDTRSYYLLDEEGDFLNFSGCGNTLNSNEPITLELIISSLRHWVINYHIDGFRFDLASIFRRGTNGVPLPHAPIIEAISKDPILANVKLIAEAWDAAGLYDVGSFYPEGDRWSEWNGVYRDTVRRFIKGTPNIKGCFASALCGSSNVYYRQSPLASVNFITSHDGFSLADLVSYNQKHNQANGENNQDGNSWNDSWNCGVEGSTTNSDILALRQKQMRNFITTLMISQGIPMLHMGDEYGHTKLGNNNTWCQDNKLSWFLWDQLEKNRALFEFFKFMTAFRKKHLHFEHKNFLTDKEVQWHGTTPFKPEWGNQNNLLALTLLHESCNIYIAFNATDETAVFMLPPVETGVCWAAVVNTSNPDHQAFFEQPQPLAVQSITLQSYSCTVLKTIKLPFDQGA